MRDRHGSRRHSSSSGGSHSSSKRRSGPGRPARSRPCAAPRRSPSRRSSRWNRSADSSISKFVWVVSRSTRLPRTRNAPSLALDREAVPARLEAVDDDAGGIGRRLEPRGGRAAGPRRPRAARRAPRPSPRRSPRRRPSASRARRKAGHASRRGGQVDLVEHDEHRLLEQRRVVGRELVADDLVVPAGSRTAPSTTWSRIRVRSTWRRKAWPRPGPADAPSIRPGTSAIVGRRPSPSPQVHHAEVRLEGRERVVRDLRRRGGERREQRGLAGVRQPDEPDVGDQPELEAEPALLAGLAPLGVLRRLVGGRREVGVAEAAAAAPRDHRLLPDRDEVGDQLAGLVVVDGRAGRDRRGTGRRRPCRGACSRRRGRRAWPRSGACSGSRGASSGRHRRADGSSRRGRRRRRRGRRGARGPRWRNVAAPSPPVAGAHEDLDMVEEHRRSIVALRRPRRPRRGGRRRRVVSAPSDGASAASRGSGAG